MDACQAPVAQHLTTLGCGHHLLEGHEDHELQGKRREAAVAGELHVGQHSSAEQGRCQGGSVDESVSRC